VPTTRVTVFVLAVLWTGMVAGDDAALATRAVELFRARCIECHGAAESNGGLRLDRQGGFERGGDSGSLLKASPETPSLLIRRITAPAADERMPPEGKALSESEVELLRIWLAAGAPWPEETTPASDETPRTWWAIQPLVAPAVSPRAFENDRSPIDRFISARLAENGLGPSLPADRRTLIRRVTVNLTGLVPSFAEVEAFVADPSPLSYEELVDRLLASPAYGERWARHWLDVVHFAETHGHDQDRPRDHAWPYRDYVIESLNADVPYPQFAAEQIAADVLAPDDPARVRALGFLSAGPWDESSLRDIREDTLDRQIARYLDRDDIVTNVMSTFTSTTVHCARCHHHKFDPISQEDYYGLQAVFAGTGKGTRTFDTTAQAARRRRELDELERELKAGTFALPETLRAAQATWEQDLLAYPETWTVVSSLDVTSAGGATLSRQPDGSILATGTSPETETCTVTAVAPVDRVTAIRLEVLPDDSLHQRGPGRQDNGNLHLSEVRISILPEGGGAEVAVPIKAAKADFDQAGWDITRAIDGNPQTAWGIYPEVGKPHAAVFELENVPEIRGTWKIVLDQQHGGRHTLGRFRLSMTAARTPSLTMAVHVANPQTLRKPRAERSAEEQRELDRVFLHEHLARERARLPELAKVYSGSGAFLADGSHRASDAPRPVHLLQRGEITRPLKEIGPGSLSCLVELPARFELRAGTNEAERRAALARWLTSQDNPLFWRSIANRVWHYHFGKGLVETPNDFGKMGGAPSHPELLDWLALRLRDSGGSLKSLHREIVLSRTYRQAVTHDPRATAIDADNRLLWRMNRTRLDAEVIRDSLLRLTSRLNDRMGGPSDRQFVMSPGIHVTPKVDYVAFLPDDPTNTRRSIYRFLFRTLPDPLMESMDCPAGDQLAPVRTESITALQAFTLLNNPFLTRHSSLLAERLSAVATTHPPATVEVQTADAFREILLRDPTASEQTDFASYTARHGLANLCRLLLNSNEFLYVE